jgi:hypothetical protein
MPVFVGIAFHVLGKQAAPSTWTAIASAHPRADEHAGPRVGEEQPDRCGEGERGGAVLPRALRRDRPERRAEHRDDRRGERGPIEPERDHGVEQHHAEHGHEQRARVLRHPSRMPEQARGRRVPARAEAVQERDLWQHERQRHASTGTTV